MSNIIQELLNKTDVPQLDDIQICIDKSESISNSDTVSYPKTNIQDIKAITPKAEKAIVEMFCNNISIAEIAQRLHHPEHLIHTYLAAAGLLVTLDSSSEIPSLMVKPIN